MSENQDTFAERCEAEAAVEQEFPEVHEICCRYPPSRPRSCEIWERILRIARNSRPILDDLRARGVHLPWIQRSTQFDGDQRVLNECLLEWLPRIDDPLTLTICLNRLRGSGIRPLLQKNRELLFRLTRDWNIRLRNGDPELTLACLAQYLMTVVRERDLPEIVNWAVDAGLPTEARASYVWDLRRFLKKSSLVRETLIRLLRDKAVGANAVWALAGVLRGEALPILQELTRTCTNERTRRAAADALGKIQARSGRIRLPRGNPAALPQGYVSTTAEFDTVLVPDVLTALEKQLGGKLEDGASDQLALAANQLKRGRSRFYIVPFRFPDGRVIELGFGFHAEDEDVMVMEICFDPELHEFVAAAVTRVVGQSVS